MGNTVWKDVLWLGRWSYPDGRVLNVRPQELQQAAANGRAMLASKLDLPWCWDHQPDALPQSVEMSASIYADPDKRADAARNTITRATVGYQIRNVPGKGPTLFAGFDPTGLSAQELDSIRRAGKVSCRVERNFVDARGSGKRYPGLAISHIAVTPKPLEPDQGPFLMSRVEFPVSDESFFLGYGQMAKNKDGDTVGSAEIESGDDIVDLENAEASTDPATPAPPAIDPNIASIMASLMILGVPLPQDNSITDIGTLALALKIAGQMGAKAGSATGDTGMNFGSGDASSGPSAPMMMSQADMQAKAPARVENDRANLRAMISLLVKKGHCDGPTRDKMLSEFDSFELSYAGSKLVSRGLLAAVRAMQKYVAPGTFLGKGSPGSFDMGQTSVVELPDRFTSESAAEKHEKDIEAKCKKLMPAKA